MPVIAIEGLDGCGKTTVAKLLATRLRCKLVEKPLRWILQEEGQQGLESYWAVVNRVNEFPDPMCRQWFHCLGWLLIHHRYPDSLVIVDRYVLSNLDYNQNPRFDQVYQAALSEIGQPLFTAVLEVTANERRRRITQRDGQDPGESAEEDARRVQRMKDFIKRVGWPHLFVATDDQTPEQVTARIEDGVALMLPPAHTR